MKKLLLSLALGAVLAPVAIAQPAGWSYVSPVTVSNTSTTSIVNYQLKLTVNTQAFVSSSQMLASGDDIRFGKTCDGATLYNYWIESGMNTTTTTIWVKIDTIPASGARTFFMFYGNSSASAASSIPSVFVGPFSATDSVSGANTGGVTNSQRGFRFSPNEDILVTQFGKNEPNGSTRYITLFDFNSQAILDQEQVSGPAAQYDYGNVANPMWLTQGTQYLLEIYQGSSDGYYYGASPQINPHLTFYDMRYCNSCAQNTFPTNSLTGMHYGYVDLMFYIKNTVTPAPTATLNQVPLLTVAQSTTSICAGGSVSFTVSSTSGLTYTWQPSGSVSMTFSDTPTTSTTYTVAGTVPGCPIGNSAMSVSVNVMPTPTVSVSGSSVICGSGSNTLTASGASTYAWTTGDLTASAVVTPTATSDYTVTGTDANGCATNVVTTVTVSAIPSVAISSPTAICIGSTAVLTASGATTYSWSNSATTTTIAVSPTVTTGYTVTGTNADGCENTAAQSLTVNSLPMVMAATSAGTICAGNSATLTASGANTYSWSTSQNAAAIVVSPPVTATYTVTGTSTSGCAATATVTQNVLPCTGVDELASGKSVIAVYPNPTSGVFTLELSSRTQIEVINLLGTVISSQTLESGKHVMSLSEQANGVYYIRARQNSHQQMLKVIKQ